MTLIPSVFNHNLISLLREFSKEEVKKFETFLDSPYHNKSKKLLQLYREIKKYYPAFSNKKLTKEYLYKKVNPSLKYHDSTIRDLMSGLLKSAEEFLTSEELMKSKPEQTGLFLKTLIVKKQNVLFDKNIKRINKELDKEGVDSNYFYMKSRLEMNKFNFNMINRSKNKLKLIEGNESILVSYITSLVNHFITEIINAYLTLLIYESKFKTTNNERIVSKIIGYIDIKKISEVLSSISVDYYILDIYSELLRTFQNINDDVNYIKYKEIFMKYKRYLSADENAFHFSMLISYCIYKTSSGNTKFDYDTELFNLYNMFLNKKYFIDNKTRYLEEDLFRNILLTALRLKKHKWVLNFINTFSKFLHPVKRANLLHLSYTEYYVSGESKNCNKDKAFKHLNEIKDESFNIKYDIKSLYLKLYYDLKYYETAYIQLNNYRKFLRRNKLVAKKRKVKLNNFLNLYEKLLSLKEGDTRIDISKLKSDICNITEIEHRDWLIKKSEELENVPYIKFDHILTLARSFVSSPENLQSASCKNNSA